MLRVIVVVTWEPIGDECDGTGGMCSYDVATLWTRHADLAWNRVIKPVAVDDTVLVRAQAIPGTNLDVMDNDVLGSVRSYPVQLVGPPSLAGQRVARTPTGTIKYTPPAGDTGTLEIRHIPLQVPGVRPHRRVVDWRPCRSSPAAQRRTTPVLTATLGVAASARCARK